MKLRKGGQCILVSTIQSGGLMPFFIDFGDSRRFSFGGAIHRRVCVWCSVGV